MEYEHYENNIGNLDRHVKEHAHKAIGKVKNELVREAKQKSYPRIEKLQSVTSKQSVLSASAQTFMATLNKTAKNNGKSYDRKSKEFKNYEDVYTTTSSVMSNFISNSFALSDLESTNRNSKLQALFYMMMGGEKKFVNFREDISNVNY